jgi:galactose mutarotase-like enzyme
MMIHSILLGGEDTIDHVPGGFEVRATPHFTGIGSNKDWYVKEITLAGGLSHGVSVVEVCNGPLTLWILPTRGMGVWKGRYRGLPLEWKSPVRRPVHPAFVNLHDRNGLGWLNGFNELMCRCGLAFNGPPGNDDGTAVTLHGRIANLPAHRLELKVNDNDNGVIELIGTVEEASMFGPRLQLVSRYRFPIGGSTCEIVDEVTNLGGTATELSLLYHINIGRPFLDDGGGNAVACREIVPRDPRSAEGIGTHAVYGPPQAGFGEQAYYYRPATDAQGWSSAVLHNRAKSAAFAVHYNASQLPCFTVWKNTQSEAEGYVTGLEPGVNLPNFRAFERGQKRLPVLAPNQTYRCEQRWEFADDEAGVNALLDDVASNQAAAKPVIHATPQPGWSPAGTPQEPRTK